MFCSSCGYDLTEKSGDFCPNCGGARPAHASTPEVAAPEVPAVKETPVAEAPTVAETPIVDAPEVTEMPAVEEVSVVEETPAVAETPMVEEVPAPAAQIVEPPVAAAQVAEATYISPDFSAEAPAKKSGGKKIALIAVIAVVIVALIGGAVWGMFFAPFAPFSPQGRDARAVNVALENLGDELSQRLNSSPLAVFGVLADVMYGGVIAVDFEYLEDSESVRGEVRIYSDSATGESALTASADVDTEAISFSADASLFANSDRIMLQSDLLGSDYFGVRFSTFANDFRQFGRLVGMSERELNDFFDIWETMEPMMSMEMSEIEDFYAEYFELLRNFAANLNSSSQRAEVDGVNVQRITYTITGDDLMDFLVDYIDLMENSSFFQSIFTMQMNMMMGMGMPAADPFAELRMMIPELRQEIQDIGFEAEISFYIDDNDRIQQLSAVAEFEGNVAGAIFNFGTSVYDTWTMDVFYTDWRGVDVTVRDVMVWEFTTNNGRYENRMTFGVAGEFSVTLISDWNSANGNFTLTAEVPDFFTGRTERHSIAGNMMLTANSFNLRFDNIDLDGGVRLSIGVGADTRANVPRPSSENFIGMDQWNEELLESIIENLMASELGLFFLGDFAEDLDYYDAFSEFDFDDIDWDALEDMDLDELLQLLDMMAL